MSVGWWLLKRLEKGVCRAGVEALGGLDEHDSSAPQMWTQRQQLSEVSDLFDANPTRRTSPGSRAFLLVCFLVRASILKEAKVGVIPAGMEPAGLAVPAGMPLCGRPMAQQRLCQM